MTPSVARGAGVVMLPRGRIITYICRHSVRDQSVPVTDAHTYTCEVPKRCCKRPRAFLTATEPVPAFKNTWPLRPRPATQFAPQNCTTFPVLAYVSPPTILKSPLEKPRRHRRRCTMSTVVAQRRLIRVDRQLGFTVLDSQTYDTDGQPGAGKEQAVPVAEL